jgi:hypothetical protein
VYNNTAAIKSQNTGVCAVTRSLLLVLEAHQPNEQTNQPTQPIIASQPASQATKQSTDQSSQ